MFHMEQDSYNSSLAGKDYGLEIIGFLLKFKTGHIRSIARTLEVNHMTILRKTKDLIEENVLDFKLEGKNKVFFLKKSVEARNHAFTYEHYKLVRILKQYSYLRNIVDKIHRDSRIKIALIFGSYAKFTADKTSDIDLFIETNKQEIRKELLLLSSKLSIKIGEYDKNNDLAKEIEKNHVIIKGVEEYYDKAGIFN